CRKSDVGERDPALLGCGHANGRRQAFDLPRFLEVRATAALTIDGLDERLYFERLELVVAQLVAGSRAECGVTRLCWAGQQSLKTIASGCACTVEAQLVEPLLIERQRAFGAADLETQVVFVAVFEPAAAEGSARTV